MTLQYILDENNSLVDMIDKAIDELNGTSFARAAGHMNTKFRYDKADDDYYYIKLTLGEKNGSYTGSYSIRIPRIGNSGNLKANLYPACRYYFEDYRQYGCYELYRVNDDYEEARLKDGTVNYYTVFGIRTAGKIDDNDRTRAFKTVRSMEMNPIGINEPLSDGEQYITYRYVTGDYDKLYHENSFGFPWEFRYGYNRVAVNEPLDNNPKLKEGLIKYFKEKWGDDYSGKIEGWNLDNVTVIGLYFRQISGLGYVNYSIDILVPRNGKRPCGIVTLFSIATDSRLEKAYNFRRDIYLSYATSYTTYDTSFYPIGVRSNMNIFDDFLNILFYRLYKNSIEPINRNGHKLYTLSTMLSLKKKKEKRFGLSDRFRSNAAAYQYVTTLTNVSLDLGKIFRSSTISLEINKDDRYLPIQTILYNYLGVGLMAEVEGMEINCIMKEESGLDYDAYTVTAKSKMAAIIFKKNSKVVVNVYVKNK